MAMTFAGENVTLIKGLVQYPIINVQYPMSKWVVRCLGFEIGIVRIISGGVNQQLHYWIFSFRADGTQIKSQI